MEVLEERKILSFLRELYESGTPFIGLSAGSIMLAREWIVWDDPNDDATSSVFPCMGFADVRCDTHGEGEGWEELRALMLRSPEGSVGYGIPTGAGLCSSYFFSGRLRLRAVGAAASAGADAVNSIIFRPRKPKTPPSFTSVVLTTTAFRPRVRTMRR